MAHCPDCGAPLYNDVCDWCHEEFLIDTDQGDLAPEMTQPVKRKPLTRREFGFLIIDQNGLCGCGCGAKLDFTKPRRVTDEHLVPLFSGGSNDLSNRALWNTECSKAKTSGEAPDRAKVRRLSGQKPTQAARRARSGGSRIQGGGFQKKPEGYVSPLNKKHPRYRNNFK